MPTRGGDLETMKKLNNEYVGGIKMIKIITEMTGLESDVLDMLDEIEKIVGKTSINMAIGTFNPKTETSAMVKTLKIKLKQKGYEAHFIGRYHDFRVTPFNHMFTRNYPCGVILSRNESEEAVRDAFDSLKKKLENQTFEDMYRGIKDHYRKKKEFYDKLEKVYNE